MINPEYKPHWRPTHDLGRRFDVRAVTEEAYKPTNVQDAIAYVRELALPEITAYDGHACQEEMIEEKAIELLTQLYDQPASADSVSDTQETNPVSDFYARHRYENGDINWNSVVRATSYVVSSTVVVPQVEPPLIEQLDEIALTA